MDQRKKFIEGELNWIKLKNRIIVFKENAIEIIEKKEKVNALCLENNWKMKYVEDNDSKLLTNRKQILDTKSINTKINTTQEKDFQKD